MKKAFKYAGLNYKKYLKIDKKFFRKKDSQARVANPKKLIKELKWKRQFNFERLVKDMVDNEIKRLKKFKWLIKLNYLKIVKFVKAVIYLKFFL